MIPTELADKYVSTASDFWLLGVGFCSCRDG
jgi:hypothetical protein